ncbi:MAG TPA: hypothetical protein DCQ31_08255 [Bacteroidales bacterium]|nr:hypothetical protein [Bacteroidales bacterium]
MNLFQIAVLSIIFFYVSTSNSVFGQENLPGLENKGPKYNKRELKQFEYWRKKLEFTPDQKLIMGKAYSNVELTVLERKQAKKLLKREQNAKHKIKEIYSNHYYNIQDKKTKKRIKETRKRAERNNKRKHPVRFIKAKIFINNIFN